jgi:hypothetical protein
MRGKKFSTTLNTSSFQCSAAQSWYPVISILMTIPPLPQGGEAEKAKGPVDHLPAERVHNVLMLSGGNNGVRGSENFMIPIGSTMPDIHNLARRYWGGHSTSTRKAAAACKGQ